MEIQRPQIAKAILRKKDGTRGINLPALRLYYKGIFSRQYGTFTKNRNIDQQNKIESPDVNPCTYGQLIFDKGGKNLQQWCWVNWTAVCKRVKLEHFLTPNTKVNPKWFKDLKIRPETVKFLDGNIGRTLFDMHHNTILCDTPPRIMEVKAKLTK